MKRRINEKLWYISLCVRANDGVKASYPKCRLLAFLIFNQLLCGVCPAYNVTPINKRTHWHNNCFIIEMDGKYIMSLVDLMIKIQFKLSL
jgi:hypothetical protein